MGDLYRRQSRRLTACQRTFLALVFVVVAARADCAWAETLSVAEFSKFSNDDQIGYLKESLLSFRERTKNLSAVVTHTVKAVEGNSMSTPEELEEAEVRFLGMKHVYEIRRIGDCYRVVVEGTRKDPRPGALYPVTLEGYDAERGELRQLDTVEERKDGPLLLAEIKPERGRGAAQCFFFQYLGAEPRPFLEPVEVDDLGAWFLLGSEAAKVLQVSTEDSSVEVSFPYPENVREETGPCHVFFDLSKGALLTGLKVALKREGKNGTHEHWGETRWTDPISIDGVWIPTRMRQYGWSTTVPNQVTIHHGIVEDIRLNELTHVDLEVVFPLGADVVDRIAGVTFKVGPNGEHLPSGITLATDIAQVVEDEEEPTRRAWVTWTLGLITVALAIALLVKRTRRRAE